MSIKIPASFGLSPAQDDVTPAYIRLLQRRDNERDNKLAALRAEMAQMKMLSSQPQDLLVIGGSDSQHLLYHLLHRRKNTSSTTSSTAAEATLGDGLSRFDEGSSRFHT